MSAWKSRWSCVRFVNAATSQWIASARCSASACEETSITHGVVAARRASRRTCAAGRSPRASCARVGCSAPPTIDGHRAEQPGAAAAGLQQRAHEEGRRRLAVRAGDADDAAAARSGRRRGAPRPGAIAARTSATTTSGTPSRAGARRRARPRPRATASGAKSWPSRGEARHAEEERPGSDDAGVVGQRRDLDRRRRRARRRR